MQPNKKLCRKCLINKNVSEFSVNRRWSDNLERICKKCITKQRKLFYWKNPELFAQRWQNSKYGGKNNQFKRAKRLLKEYNLPIQLWNCLNLLQKSKCAICNQKTSLVVDHNHNTKQVRGLLCHKCNRGLGHFDDNIELLQKTIIYLEESELWNQLV
jgi:hypothetical protein